jgi:hypothetical protein
VRPRLSVLGYERAVVRVWYKARSVLPVTVGIRDGVVQLVSILGGVVSSARTLCPYLAPHGRARAAAQQPAVRHGALQRRCSRSSRSSSSSSKRSRSSSSSSKRSRSSSSSSSRSSSSSSRSSSSSSSSSVHGGSGRLLLRGRGASPRSPPRRQHQHATRRALAAAVDTQPPPSDT